MGESRKPSTKKAQLEYQRRQRAAGKHVQINVTLKTEEDRAMMDRLRQRFPGEKDPAITRRSLKKLDEIECQEGVYDFQSGERRDDDENL